MQGRRNPAPVPVLPVLRKPLPAVINLSFDSSLLGERPSVWFRRLAKIIAAFIPQRLYGHRVLPSRQIFSDDANEKYPAGRPPLALGGKFRRHTPIVKHFV
jgi:hypothetical protein